ncbi:MAG: hypothetical protein IT323_00420 [Anaerolineae bacterium]|nr:hypothetical protein [Anaerolineae bacterium]
MLGAGKTREISPEEAERRHRLRGIHAHGRTMRRRILIPLILVGLLVIGGPLALLLAAGPERFHSVSNFLSMIVGVQLALVCALSMLVIVLATYLVAKVYSKLGGVATTAYNVSRGTNLNVKRLSRRIANPVIALRTRTAFLERLASRLEAQTEPSPVATSVKVERAKDE